MTMALRRSKIASLFNPTTRPSLYLYLGLRFLQFGATTLGLAFFCSLIGWHNGHYCSKKFYHYQCTQSQRDYAKVPLRYIIFVVTYCLVIVAAFGLFCRHVSSFLDSMTISNGLAGLSNNSNTIVHSKKNTSPFLELCRRTFRSAPKLALLIDSTFLIVVSVCLCEYVMTVILPYHVHPESGSTHPVCMLFERSGSPDPYYWKNLSVEKQRCMDNLISYECTIWVVIWTALLIIFDAFYLHYDLSNKHALKDDLGKASEKQLLIDIAA